MGREVRRVPANWQHPRYSSDDAPGSYAIGRLKPLNEGFEAAARSFLEMANKQGLQSAIEYFGRAPDQTEYMPEWPYAERTHLMMYETTSEGTPLSPAFATPEELAHWLVANKASAFGDQTASYEAWLRIANGGYAPSAVMESGRLLSGVEACREQPNPTHHTE